MTSYMGQYVLMCLVLSSTTSKALLDELQKKIKCGLYITITYHLFPNYKQ